MHKLSIHRWQESWPLLFGFALSEGIIIFNLRRVLELFLSSSFVTVLSMHLRSSLLKSYDLQYLKQMSIFTFRIDLYQWVHMALTASLSLIQTGAADFVTALFGSHLFGLAMLWVRRVGKNKELQSRIR